MSNNHSIVGAKIKGLRESKNLSIEEIAERSGLTVEQITSIETDQTLPSLGPLIKSDVFRPGAKCVIDLVINYTKESKIYSKSSIFPIFTYTESGINKNTIDLIIDNEIRVYFDQSSELLSLERVDQSVDEYIIEGCTARIIL